MQKGEKRGKLTFVRYTGFRTVPSGRRRSVGLFKCDCGNEKETVVSAVNRNKILSCGCVNKERIRQLGKKLGKERGNFVHGLFGTPFYHKYYGLKRRCEKPIRWYGADGIKNEFTSFNHFYQTMYKSYLEHVKVHGKRQTTIDRINPSKNYSPDNCRWATYAEQGVNRRNNLFVTIKGKTQTLSQWERELGLCPRAIKRMAGKISRGTLPGGVR